jgi:opacity protein-like surface antigen
MMSLWSWEASGQTRGRYEAGLLVGWTKTSAEGSALTFDVSSTYQATFAWRVWQGPAVSLALEVPLFAAPAIGVKTVGATLPKEYAALFLTPGVRVSFRPGRPVSLFGAVGGGYARYSEGKHTLDNNPNPLQQDTNAGALQVGAGVNIRGSNWLGLRGEVRDVWTGPRNFSVPTPKERVHNVIASVGIVLFF